MSSDVRISFSAALAILSLATAAHGEKLTRTDLGFEFAVPDGFHRMPPTGKNVVVEFADGEVDSYETTRIIIERLRQTVSPRKPTQGVLVQRPGIKLTLQEHPWKRTTLEAVRQDIDNRGRPIVGFITQFPLKDEGIQLRVQGPGGSNEQVSALFSECIEGFHNLKTYVLRSEIIEIERAGTWAPHRQLIATLEDPKDCGSFTIRPPIGYQFLDVTAERAERSDGREFVMTKIVDGSRESQMTLLCMPAHPNFTPSEAVAALLNPITKSSNRHTIGKMLTGRISGLSAVRRKFGFTDASGSYAGFALAIQDRKEIRAFLAFHPAEVAGAANIALNRLFTSALTSTAKP